MKIKIILLLSILFGVNQAEKVVGEYHNHFGRSLTLNPDSTFVYRSGFDTVNFWSKGTWEIKKNVIYLKVIPIYDTIRITGNRDSLRLSWTEKPHLISADNIKDILYPKSYGEQSLNIIKRLYYKKKRLFEFDQNGKLLTEKRKRIWGNEKYDPWFTKTE